MERTESIGTEPLASEQGFIQGRFIKVDGKNKDKVLIVEDESELAEVLEFNLLRKGFDVLLATDGLEACRLIGQEKPDLILLDLLLPLLDGWEICRMVRSHHDQRVAKTPIIMLSALGSSDDRIKGYDLGADLYLPKPYAIKEVILKSQQLIRQRREFLQLSEQMSSLQSRNEQQDQWQQALFHELRNQMTVISGIAEHIQDATYELQQERSAHFASQIANSSHFLGAIAENYLLIRQIEDDPKNLQAEFIQLKNLLAEVAQLFDPLATKNACELEIICPSDIILKQHPTGLKLIISSLLDNALKYSPVDGHVSMSVDTTETQIILQVQDYGPGIPEAERSKVFEKFYRGASVRATNSGTGLGLYMARTLSESMGGSLRLIDQHRPGCCFALSLPR